MIDNDEIAFELEEAYRINRNWPGKPETQERLAVAVAAAVAALGADRAAPDGTPSVMGVRERIAEKLSTELGDAFDCTRVRSAWGYGTMTEDDFVPVTERLDEIVDGILSAQADALGKLLQENDPTPAEEEDWNDTPKPTPAVPIDKSVSDDYITCLEDGKKFKSLKRHLLTHYGMTPEQYREKWKLPPDYPMIAPSYAAARTSLANATRSGIDKRRRK